LRILVVEDETKVARALREGLERERYEVVVTSTGEEGFFLVNAEEFDLFLLDLMLPGRDGLQVLSTLRKRGLKTPVLLLTARDAIEDRVEGLDRGADDYLVKPFAFPELLARVRALLRRGRTEQVHQLSFTDLELDVVTRKAKRAIEHSNEITRGALAKESFWQELNKKNVSLNLRQKKVLNKLLGDFEGKLTREKWMRLTKASSRTALRDIDELIELGVLEQEGAGGRSTSYRLKKSLR
jgi:DNA-binding response OmpR family regulator